MLPFDPSFASFVLFASFRFLSFHLRGPSLSVSHKVRYAMSFLTLLRRLPLSFPKLSPVYSVVYREHPELADYPTLDSLLAVFKARGPETVRARKALLCTLIDLNRKPPRRELWSTILCWAFSNVLRKIRKKLYTEDPETTDALVFESFFDVLSYVRTDDVDRIFLRVRGKTRRRILRAFGNREAWEAVGFGVEGDLEPDPVTEAEPRLYGVWSRSGVSVAASAELLATVGDRGALKLLVRVKFPEQDRVQQARTFKCLERRRARLVARIRSEVGEADAPGSPRRGGAAPPEGGSSPLSSPPASPPSSPGLTGPDVAPVPGGNRPVQTPRTRRSRAGSLTCTSEVSS
jgi:hypothetical protein